MLPASQYQLTNQNDPERKYTYHARIVTAPPTDKTGWQVSITGEHQCSPEEACKRLLDAMDEVRAAIEASTAGAASVEVDIEIGPPPVAPALAPSPVSNVGGMVVEVREAGQPAGGDVPRPPGWPSGDTY